MPRFSACHAELFGVFALSVTRGLEATREAAFVVPLVRAN